MSLGLFPLVLFLLYATIQDVRSHSVERITFAIWGAVALIGWWLGAWPFSWPMAAYGYAVMWIADTGSGDRLGAALIGGLMGAPDALYPLSVALGFGMLHFWRSKRPPQSLPLYPFLSLGVAAMILFRLGEGYLRGYLRG